jgi:N-glycosidase YbiA
VTTEVLFYSVGDDYGELSNFAAYPIRLDGATWPTSEHYFQAQKFKDHKLRERIRKANTPAEAARLGRSRKHPLRRDWESAKLNVMRKAVVAKFEQHNELAALLRQTEDARIAEHTSNDSFWGDGGDGSGRNWLGRILMDVRADLLAG